MQNASERYVQLRGGLVVPVAPIALLLDLESRGLTLSRDGDDLLISPPGRLTDDDRAALRRWKCHVLALMDYQVPERVQ